MPYLDIKLSGPCLPANIEKFAARMTDLVVDILHKKREVTAVAVHCVPPDHWCVGGDSITAQGRASFFLEANVTAGTNSAGEKDAFIAAAFETAEGILGKLDVASYVIVREVPADAWGYQGLTQEYRRLHHKPA
jgi:4-oxalocrotonate tautomerase